LTDYYDAEKSPRTNTVGSQQPGTRSFIHEEEEEEEDD
jgi:hypothetical protein